MSELAMRLRAAALKLHDGHDPLKARDVMYDVARELDRVDDEKRRPPARRRIGGLDALEPDGSEDAWDDTRESLTEAAHGLICMVDGSSQGWQQPDDWVEAADRWIARYERVIRSEAHRRAADPVTGWCQCHDGSPLCPYCDAQAAS